MFDILKNNGLFPLYRKYTNNKSYFKVMDMNTFEEIQVLGKNYWIHTFEAKILPDRYFIKDLIEMDGNRWNEITEQDYHDFKEMCRRNYRLQP